MKRFLVFWTDGSLLGCGRLRVVVAHIHCQVSAHLEVGNVTKNHVKTVYVFVPFKSYMCSVYCRGLEDNKTRPLYIIC